MSVYEKKLEPINMNRKKQMLCLLASAFLASCASTHNLKGDSFNPLGGGYLVNKVKPGTFRITAKTNWAPWTNYSGARNMWEREAKKACAGSYSEMGVTERDYEGLPSPYPLTKYIVTEKDGYAVCDRPVSNETN